MSVILSVFPNKKPAKAYFPAKFFLGGRGKKETLIISETTQANHNKT